jgi:hypothetical protein
MVQIYSVSRVSMMVHVRIDNAALLIIHVVVNEEKGMKRHAIKFCKVVIKARELRIEQIRYQ